MKTFTKMFAQGDVLFERINELPKKAKLIAPIKGRVIVAHSETGHHHVMDADRTELYRLPEEIYECFLVVHKADDLVHLRSYDTHETVHFEPGIYRVQRQREHTPEGLRRVED